MREARVASFGPIEPQNGVHGVVERPPPGPARGGIVAPGSAVVVLSAALVLVTLLYYALRLRKARIR
jgi:hypothetical protein